MSVSLDTIRAGDVCIVTDTNTSCVHTILITGHDSDGDLELSTPFWSAVLGYSYIDIDGSCSLVVDKVLYNFYTIHKNTLNPDGTQR